MIDQAVLRLKSGLSGFYPHFLLPQVDSLAPFAPTSEIKNVFRVKNRVFSVRKKAAMEYPPPLVEKNMKKPVTTCHLGIPRLQAHS